MKTLLTAYGHLAEKHWRQFCPRLVAELEAKGQLHAILLEAEEKTERGAPETPHSAGPRQAVLNFLTEDSRGSRGITWRGTR